MVSVREGNGVGRCVRDVRTEHERLVQLHGREVDLTDSGVDTTSLRVELETDVADVLVDAATETAGTEVGELGNCEEKGNQLDVAE
jgi:hypothetical protein